MFCNRDGIMGRMTSHRKIAAAAALGAAHAASAGAILKTYVGPVNGQWNVATNWSPIGVPNNGGGFIYDALIDGDRDASAVTLAGGFTINLLGITVGDSLTITNGSTLGMAGGTLSNFGTLVLGSINATTDLRVDSGSLIIGGPGLTLATNTQNNRIYTTSSASRITIADDHTLAGSFQLGVNQTRLTNDGVIDANLSNGVTVDLTDGAGINFNTGTMRASAGGVMMIGGTTLDNTGGTIEADSGSFVSLSNAHIIGGLINDVDGAGAGGIRTTSAAVLESVTIAGGYTGLNGTTTVGRETIATQAPLSLASINATTDFRVDTATFLLGGSGGIACSNTQNNRIYTSSSAARITVAPESSIAGSFQLGANQTRLTNQGVINASSSNGSTIDLTDGAGINFNSGLLLATNGATLTIGGTTLDNSGGVIEAGPDSFVNLPSAHIIGGTLLDADGPGGAGSIRTTGASVLESVTVQGGYVGLNGTLTVLRGGIDLQAPLFLLSINATTDLRIDTTP